MPQTTPERQSMTTSLPYMPGLKGRLRRNADIARNTWFQVGGPAEWLFKPADAEDLQIFFEHLPHEVPMTLIGVGSNLLIRDGGIDGVVVRLGRGFTAMEILPDGETLRVGAACLDLNVAEYACQNGIAGLEFLSGIPGTIGGAVRMNAGAYEKEIKDVLVSAEVMYRDGSRKTLSLDELGFQYRSSELPEDAVVIAATLKGAKGNPQEVAAAMQKIQTARADTQPIRSRTGGSTFKNPKEKKAWELIDQAGCRGLKRGGAMVSDKHCNFLINTGDATATELEELGEEVRAKVKEKSGIELHWEIKRIGNKP